MGKIDDDLGEKVIEAAMEWIYRYHYRVGGRHDCDKALQDLADAALKLYQHRL